jgi:predicted SprT family Zn-dependent metalloprotease
MAHALAEIFHDLNREYFAGELPLPELEWNSRLSSTAGRFCPGSRRPIFPRAPKIEVATYLREISDGPLHIRDTVLHEMIHYLLWHRKQPYGHTAEFHRIMKRVGAKRYNPVPKERPVKYWYECPGCQRKIPARRRMDKYACLVCCEKENGGKFAEKFRLRLGAAPAAAPKTILHPAPAGSAQAPSGQGPGFAPSPVEKRELDLACSLSAGEKANAPLPPKEIVRRLEELKQLLLRS